MSYAVLADGSLSVLVTDVDLAGEHERFLAAWRTSTPLDPPSRLQALAAAGLGRLMVTTAGGWTVGPACPLETPFPKVDRFSDGRWLVVAARTDDQPNARMLAPDGALIARFMLGDGIEHVAIDQQDRIWVGWFDEGMFGNDDWRMSGHDWASSRNGVGCFEADGSLASLPTWPPDAGTIADCYALNATGAGAWACPYTEFPLVRFEEGRVVRWWRSDLAGPRAIAVAGRYAVLAGGYREDAARLTLVELAGEGAGEAVDLLASWALPLRPLPVPANEWAPVWNRPDLLAGRGDTLHLVDGGIWYRWTVDALVAEAGRSSG